MSRHNVTDSGPRPGCPAVPGARFGYLKVGKFIFVNSCQKDIVLSGWDCVVPAGGSCTVGHDCQGKATYTGKKLCSQVPPTWKPKGHDTVLKWCLAEIPNSCSMIELNVAWPGEGFCLNRMNGQMHIGFTSSWRAELLKSGTQTPACRDYGMEQAIDDATIAGKALQCPHGTQALHAQGLPTGCNTYACYCKGKYLPHNQCQVVTPCEFVYQNMWTMIYDGAKKYNCKGFCPAARAGVPGAKGCGWKAKPSVTFGKPEVSNYWYSDAGGPGNPEAFAAHWVGGGILGDDATCKKGLDPTKESADLRVTSCGIPKTHSPDKDCCCGASEAPGIGCPSTYSMCH